MVVSSVFKLGALLTATGMSFGAFGAHGLRARNLPEKALNNWSTASQYMIYSGLSLFAISFHPSLERVRRYRYAPGLIATGAVVFSGTIFGLVLLPPGHGGRKVLGPLTPLGGVLMIGGYILLAL